MKSRFNRILHHVVKTIKEYRDINSCLYGKIELYRIFMDGAHYLFVRCKINYMTFEDFERLHNELPIAKITSQGLQLMLDYEEIMSNN